MDEVLEILFDRYSISESDQAMLREAKKLGGKAFIGALEVIDFKDEYFHIMNAPLDFLSQAIANDFSDLVEEGNSVQNTYIKILKYAQHGE